jgi:cytochrome P450
MEFTLRKGIDSETTDLSDMGDVRRILCSAEWLPDLGIAENFRKQSDVPVLLALSGVAHDVHRHRVDRPFLPASVAEWSNVIAKVADSLPEISGAGVIQAGSDFARPLAVTTACKFVGVSAHSAKEVSRIVDPLFSAQPLSEARQALCGFRLYRMVKKELEVSAADRDHEHCLLNALGKTPEDAVAVSLSMLTAGTEVTARAILACIVHFGRTGLRDASQITNGSIDQAITDSKILTHVNRIHSRSSQKQRVSLCPVQANGAPRDIPFGFGHHFCLGASWVREVCRCAIASLVSRFGEIRIESISRSSQDGSSALVGGILNAEMRLG